MAHWRNIQPEGIAEGRWVMDRSTYFGSYAFPKEDIDRFFALVGTDIVSMKHEVMNTYSMSDLKPFHVLPFAKWPLVEMGNLVSCVSVRLFKQKLTTGLHHLFLDENKFPDKGDRRRYLNYMGAVFEDYVSRLLDRAFPPASNRCLKADVLTKAVGDGKSCDFSLLYGDAIILLETKATRFTLGARTEANWEEYERQFTDIFLDGASQISNTIDAIESGRLVHLGIDPNRIRSYFPLIVTLEHLPMSRVIYRRVYEEICTKGVLQHPKTRPLQAIDIGELEFIEIGLHAGRSLRDILQEKLATDDGRDESMSNYLIGRREPFILGPVNKYLGDLYTQIGDRAIEFFRRNKREQD